jgi:hypothetical protein
MGWSISDENEMSSQNVEDGPGIVFGVEEIFTLQSAVFIPLPVFTLSA